MHERDESVLPALPRRESQGHKGTYGTVAIVGGCAAVETRMIGAPCLAARGALRAGAGLVRLVMPEPVLDDGLVIEPSATGVGMAVDGAGALVAHEAAAALDGVLGDASCLAIGPGMGVVGTGGLVLRAVGQMDCPVVVDADALNALAGMVEFDREIRARAVLTPHPGEFGRLAAVLRIDADPTDPAQRARAAAELAARLGVVVVLKGAGTVVSDGLRAWTCNAGGPVLAAGGSGDVLTGVIAGLIGQFVRRSVAGAMAARMPIDPEHPLDLYDAARVGVEAHARAGDTWAGRHGDAGMRAMDLADLIPEAIEGLRVSK